MTKKFWTKKFLVADGWTDQWTAQRTDQQTQPPIEMQGRI